MTLIEFVNSLQDLVERGYEDLEVFYIHGSSGDVGEIGSGHITDRQGVCGPFEGMGNYKDGDSYVSIYIGN